MKPFVSKSKTKRGIELSAESHRRSCNIELIIPNQYCTYKHALKVEEYPVFKLNVKFSCKGGAYPNGLHLSFENLPYPKDGKGNINLGKDAAITVDLVGKDYSGTLTIYRMGYMSSNLLGRLRKERKNLAGDDIVIHERYPKPTLSKYTLYTNTNIRKPYRG